MSQRTIILLFAALVLLIVTGFVIAWYLLFAGNTSTSGGETSNPFNFLTLQDSPTPTTEPEAEVEPQTEEPLSTEPLRLRLITQDPTSAITATNTPRGLMARYISRSNGHIFETPLEREDEATRLSNTTSFRLQEADWLPNANNIVIRFLDETLEKVDTYLGYIDNSLSTASSTESSLSGAYLDMETSAMAVSRTGNKIAYTANTPAGTGIYTANADGTSKTLAYVSPVKGWLLQWVRGDTLALTTKPSGSAPGFMYFLGIKSGALERIIPGTFGLTTSVSPAGEYILYSESVEGELRTYAHNKTSRKTLLLPIATLPEKCAWSAMQTGIAYCGVPDALPETQYPDAWYMGLVQFRDHLWRIDATSGGATLLEIPGPIAENGIDMVNMSLSKDEKYLVFKNRTDDSAWSYSLSGL